MRTYTSVRHQPTGFSRTQAIADALRAITRYNVEHGFTFGRERLAAAVRDLLFWTIAKNASRRNTPEHQIAALKD